MSFFEHPILNSPYLVPEQHWELDGDGRPTDTVIAKRRRSDLISAMPKPKSVKGKHQSELDLNAAGLEGQDMAYNVTEFVNEMRSQVDAWRGLPNPNDWQVSPITQRLLQHWRAIQKDETQVIRPFFCQLEAVETAIWMTEVAPKMGERGRRVRRRLEAASFPRCDEAGNGGGQDHGDGHAYRVADPQCRAQSQFKNLLARVSDCDTRHHDPGSSAGSAAE
jgi:type III restriction enzyme